MSAINFLQTHGHCVTVHVCEIEPTYLEANDVRVDIEYLTNNHRKSLRLLETVAIGIKFTPFSGDTIWGLSAMTMTRLTDKSLCKDLLQKLQ